MKTSAQRLAIFSAKLDSRSAFKYPDRCTFKRIAETKGSAGGNVRTATATSSSVPCFLAPVPVRNAEHIVSMAAQSEAIYDITIPGTYSSALVDVDAKCQAIVAARGGEPQRTYNVVEVERGSLLETVVRASITEPQSAA